MKSGFQVFYRYKELEDGDKVLVKKKKWIQELLSGRRVRP